MKKTLLTFILCLASPQLFAGSCDLNTGYCQGYIEILQPHVDSNGNTTVAYLKIEGTGDSALNFTNRCTTYPGNHIFVNKPDSNDRIFSLLLAAQLASKEVLIRIKDISTDSDYCSVTLARIK